MQETLAKFRRVIQAPGDSLTEWRQHTNKKIIGCFPMHIPEEVIHAADMLPVVLWESDEPITQAHGYMQPAICGFTRSILDIGLKGKLNFLDGWVFLDCCLAPRGLAFLVKRRIRPAYCYTMYLPHLLEQAPSKDYMVRELNRFRASLQEFAGHEITSESLRESIATYNENRSLLRKLYDLRRENAGLLGAGDTMAVVMSSMLMPKEEHSELLHRLLAELEKQRPSHDGKVRLVLTGSLCQAARVDMLHLIEEAGGLVVDDDLYVGSRYMATDASVDADPIESLANRFLEMRYHCPTKSDPQNEWAEQLVELVKRTEAQGVISLEVKFCEPVYFHYPDLRRAFDRAGIPQLELEMEHEVTSGSLGQFRTRIAAFVEQIGGV